MTSPTLVTLSLPDEAAAWEAAGFTVEGNQLSIGALRVECRGDAGGPAFVFDRPHPEGLDHLDGMAWRVAAGDDDRVEGADRPVHPNGIDDIDHVVVMAGSLEGVRAALLGAGFEIRRERPTRLGETAITQMFAWAGPVVLEIVAPTDATDSGGGSSIWGLAAVATELDATVTYYGDGIGAARAAVQPGRRIATVRHRELRLSLQLAVMTPR